MAEMNVTGWRETGWGQKIEEAGLSSIVAELMTQFARQAVEQEREACAMLHEQIDPACDHERQNGDPGAGAMGAVIEYRDLIRARGKQKDPPTEAGGK